MIEKNSCIKSKALEFFNNSLISSKEETLFSLLLQGIKFFNMAVLAKIEVFPLPWKVYRHLHNQLYKDAQLYSLLTRSTGWASLPHLYIQSHALNLDFFSSISPAFFSLEFLKEETFFKYLALSHACKAEIRIIPLLPPTLQFNTPFLEALHEIEVQNGREIQTQIAFLKNLEVSFSLQEKEKILLEQKKIVENHFNNYLNLILKS